MECPIHKKMLYRTETQYGDRWQCPETGCDVACWGGETSTPADGATRTARNAAHAAFDTHWQLDRIPREEAYRRLSEFLGLEPEYTHIGMFDLETCKKVEEFSMKLGIELLKNKF